LCPSGLTDREVTTAPHNVTPSEFIPPTTGEGPYTTHYYGINGPRGANPAGGQYPVFTRPDGTVPMHENAPLAASGMMQRDTPLHLTDATDGTSNTLLIGEMSWWVERTTPLPGWGTRYRSWLRGTNGAVSGTTYDPNNYPGFNVGARNINYAINSVFTANVTVPYNDVPMGSMHSGGANFGLGDGSVRFIRETIDMNTYRALASRNGGEVLGDY
jgi:prepilin-type processing-associated H-X9-DG protein